MSLQSYYWYLIFLSNFEKKSGDALSAESFIIHTKSHPSSLHIFYEYSHRLDILFLVTQFYSILSCKDSDWHNLIISILFSVISLELFPWSNNLHDMLDLWWKVLEDDCRIESFPCRMIDEDDSTCLREGIDRLLCCRVYHRSDTKSS